jgi:hypothetical protein
VLQEAELSGQADSENNLGGSSDYVLHRTRRTQEARRLDLVQTRTEGTRLGDHSCAAESGSHGPRSSLVFLKPVKKPGSECSVRVSDDVCRRSQRSRLGDCLDSHLRPRLQHRR